MTIVPGELMLVTAAADPETVVEANFSVLNRLLYTRVPTYQNDAPTQLIGPPASGDRVENEFWRDTIGGEWICTATGDPGTWVQIRPAIVDAEPETSLTGYWIIRRDLGFKHYRHTGSGFAEMFLSLSGGEMTGLLTLSENPSAALHAATKAYVDALAGGTDLKESCRAATTADVDLAIGGLLTIDGVTLDEGDRVLVMHQTNAEENGIYVADDGGWTRALDANTDDLVTSGMYCFVTEGTVNGDKGFVLTTNDPIILDTTELAFTQFSRGLSDGECTDAKIGDRTVNQALASPADTGSLTALLSWLAGRIKGITGKSDWKTAPQTTLENASIIALNFVIDGGGSALTAGQKGFLEVPFGMTITGVTMLADLTGSAVLDIWKDSYANYPPTVADSITASAKPTITSAVKTKDTTLTGWTTTVNAGDILAFNLDSVSTIQRLTVSLAGKKT